MGYVKSACRHGSVRVLLVAGCVSALALFSGCVTPGASVSDGSFAQFGEWSAGVYAMTETGIVRGESDDLNTLVWRGIPYASPPVGERRWKAPVPAEPWDGVREARDFGSACVQYSPVFRGRITGSEDCLYLNLWRPNSEAQELPVYVWIHGGGNSIGSAHLVPDYHGDALAARGDLIFVSLNYRLGPFGWFTSPEIRSQSDPADASGNYGTLDIIRALEWVRDNIASFGGDPDRVTIAGESAGGLNVLSLMVSDLAVGLFHRAVVQSGVVESASTQAGDEASTTLFDSLEPADGGDAERLDAARGLDAKQVMESAAPASLGMTGAPAVFADGYVLPDGGVERVLDGWTASDVPLLIGSNAEEVKLFLWFGRDPGWRDPLYQAVGRFSSLRWKAEAVDAVASSLSSTEGREPVYAYWFRWGTRDATGESPLPRNWPEKLGAFHTLEIPFFLGTDTINGPLFTPFLFTRGNRPGREALSRAMSSYLIGFVHDGDPNSRIDDSLPRWQPWSLDPTGPRSIIFDIDGDTPAVTMMREQFTVAGILESMQDELPPAIYQETREYLDR